MRMGNVHTSTRCAFRFGLPLLIVAAGLLAKLSWDDEENPFNGVYIGEPGVLRVHLHCLGGGRAPFTAYASSIEALIAAANRECPMAIESITTNSGQNIRRLVSHDGTSCIADDNRCVFDGSSLYAHVKT